MWLLRKAKEIWEMLQNHGRSPSPSIVVHEPTDSTTLIEIVTNQKPRTIDVVASKQQYTDRKPDGDRGSTNFGSAHLLSKSPPRLFALIIGINEYESRNIKNLFGAVADADAIRDYLQEDLGVPSSQIRNLRDSQATRTAIINEIRALSTNNYIEEGDPILIYFAGHGASAKTPETWEAGSTGKTELLVPYDYSSRLEDGCGSHEQGIPDRTLGALLSHIASMKGDNITVILDCCHSGSGTRNHQDCTELVRGIDVGNIPSDLDQDVWSGFDSENVERGSQVHSGFARRGLRSHVLLAASRAEELAYERTSRGVFTVALLKTLKDVGIDKLTYASLLQRMPHLPNGQNPQCEGVNQHRIIFNAKAPGKLAVYYRIRKEGERYVIPDAGSAHGITVGAEFRVYQEQDFGNLLGVVVAMELSPFSTILDARESRFALEKDGVALQNFVGIEEHVRIHVADKKLKGLVGKMDPSQRIIRLVDRAHEADFGMGIENGKVVFHIFDPDVTKYGLTRMPLTLEPTLDDLSPVIRAAAHFYWHRRRTPQTSRTRLADFVEIEVTELRHNGTYDDSFEPVLAPTNWKRGKDFSLQIKSGNETIYGWKIINKSKVPLYPALFYFDNSDWSIISYYQPPTARGIVDPPLKDQGYLPVGYGDSGSVPHVFYLREGQNVDVGFLKLFLSRKQVDLSHVAQTSPFNASVESRSTAPASETMVKSMELHLPWDTIVVPVIQRRAER